MTKEEAREVLEDWLNSTYPYITLPVYDVVLKGLSVGEGVEYTITDYSFRELVKFIYDLKEKDEN